MASYIMSKIRTGILIFSKKFNFKKMIFNQSLNSQFKINGQLFKSLDNYKSQFDHHCTVEGLTSFFLEWFNEKKHITLETSGSTGSPKKINIKKTVMINSAKKTAEFFGLKEGDRVLLCLPIKYIAGKMMVVRSLVIGLDMYIVESNSSPIKMTSNNYDFAAMVPNQVEKNINYLNKIKVLLVGGAPISNSLSKLLHSKTNGVYETFGMTETASHVAIKNLSTGEKSFKALPGISFESENDQLVINAPHLNNNKIVTNDIIELKSNQSFIWKARKDFVINCGGIKYFPELIEKKIIGLEDRSFIVCGIPDPLLSQKIVIVFELSTPVNTQTIFKKLSKYEIPKLTFYLKKFPRINGKIDRQKIQDEVLKFTKES
ncbi:MAG: O-succinylbenzoic acid--CoA ligase [Flavobacteriaceae bacterium]|nr:O-succinylbenzoic acid--CoA ligase [Flavobacteriaceae bacterium]